MNNYEGAYYFVISGTVNFSHHIEYITNDYDKALSEAGKIISQYIISLSSYEFARLSDGLITEAELKPISFENTRIDYWVENGGVDSSSHYVKIVTFDNNLGFNHDMQELIARLEK